MPPAPCPCPPIPPVPPIPPISHVQTCPPNFLNLFENSCYYFANIQRSWKDSESACRSMNAYLLIIESRAEAKAIQQQLQLITLPHQGKWKLTIFTIL